MTKAKNREFMQLYEKHHQALSHFCRSIERDEEDAKELMSETISRAYINFEKLLDPRKFKSFLFGIASNTLKESIRKKSRTNEQVKVVSIRGKATEQVEQHTINLILSKIPDKQAEVFLLFEIADMSLADITESLNLNLSTVKTRLSRARQSLVNLLSDEFQQHISNF